MLISELAEHTNTTSKTIRYWEEIGVMPSPKKNSSGYREYDESFVESVKFIQTCQSLGFSLGEIKEIVSYKDKDEKPCLYVVNLLKQHFEEIDQRISELKRVRLKLKDLTEKAATLRIEECDPSVGCHIIRH
jgi:DNA-binding transcriptional MerR regulator